jgi:hypothetical protein
MAPERATEAGEIAQLDPRAVVRLGLHATPDFGGSALVFEEHDALTCMFV